MLTPAAFIVRFPEFTLVDPARIQLAIDDATLFMNAALWGNFYDLGMAYRVAHDVWAGTPAGVAAGQAPGADFIINKKVGEVVQGYDPIAKGKLLASPYLASKYGQMFLYYQRLLGPGATAI